MKVASIVGVFCLFTSGNLLSSDEKLQPLYWFVAMQFWGMENSASCIVQMESTLGEMNN